MNVAYYSLCHKMLPNCQNNINSDLFVKSSDEILNNDDMEMHWSSNDKVHENKKTLRNYYLFLIRRKRVERRPKVHYKIVMKLLKK